MLLGNALLALGYHSLINARKPALAEMAAAGRRGAALALAVSSDASPLINVYQLSVMVLRFLSAGLAAIGLAPRLALWLAGLGMDSAAALILAELVVLIVGAGAMLIAGGQIPATIGAAHAERLAPHFARPMALLVRLLRPFSDLARVLSDGVVRLLGVQAQGRYVTEEEIMTLVDAGQEEGVIEDEEKEMIYSIFQFGDTLAREVMVPRIDMVALEIDTPLEEALKVIVEAGHSRIPVYEESIDHLRGLLYAKDLLMMWRDGDTQRPIRDILRPAYFVPESKKAVDLLTELQQRKIHLAIVVDEYGGTAGLVTLEDLIEEIVGEIRDEYDFNEEEAFQQVDEHEYIFDAGFDLDDLNRLLDIHLPTDESDTLGGFVFSKLGKVPVEGEQIETEHVHIEVLNVDDRRIRKIRVVKIPPPTEPLEDSREEPAAAPD